MDGHVYTIAEGRVGGRPGPMRVPWDLKGLRREGYTAIVSFECAHVDGDAIRAAGLEHRRICVEDFTAPTFDQMVEFNEFVDRAVAEGGRILAHCYAGRGRTGTMLASHLVWRGSSVEDAVSAVRAKIMDTQGTLAGAIEPVQLEALHHFARSLASRRGSPTGPPTRRT